MCLISEPACEISTHDEEGNTAEPGRPPCQVRLESEGRLLPDLQAFGFLLPALQMQPLQSGWWEERSGQGREKEEGGAEGLSKLERWSCNASQGLSRLSDRADESPNFWAEGGRRRGKKQKKPSASPWESQNPRLSGKNK